MTLQEAIESDSPLIFEGAMGTLLHASSVPADVIPDLAVIQYANCVREAHAQYIASGARVIKTNTFGANRVRLTQSGIENKVDELNTQAVMLAHSAARANSLIAGCLGPTGLQLSSNDDGSSLEETFIEQAESLIRSQVDLLLIETMYDLREALIALRACRTISSCPVIVTFTFTYTPHGFLTLAGDAAGDALRELVDAGADAVGSNCNLDCARMTALAKPLRAHLPDTPILLQPCAGQPIYRGDTVEYPDSPAVYSDHMMQLVDLGVEMIGGCCGTTPAHIRALRDAVDQRDV